MHSKAAEQHAHQAPDVIVAIVVASYAILLQSGGSDLSQDTMPPM